jgi:hypothetical protein
MSMTDPLFRFPQLASLSTWRNLFISFFGKVWRVVRTSQSKLEFLLHVEGLYGNPRNTHPTSRFHAPNGLLEYYNKTRSRTIDEYKVSYLVCLLMKIPYGGPPSFAQRKNLH